jgi:uncharacterized protein (UPF0333 family)
MRFKKILKSSQKAQATLEYFLLLLVIATLTLVLSSSTLLSTVKTQGLTFFQTAAERILVKE